MGNHPTIPVQPPPPVPPPVVRTDDELLFEIQQEINKQVALDHDTIYVRSLALREYISKHSGKVVYESLKTILNAYKRPYTLAIGPVWDLDVSFIVFPS